MRALTTLAAVLALQAAASAQVSFTGGTLTENFDIMGPDGLATPLGWTIGLNGDQTVVALNDGTVGPNAGINGFNVGTTGAADRALGTGPTGGNRSMQVAIVNNSGGSILAFRVLYDGEHWREASAATPAQDLAMQFSSDGTTFVSMGAGFTFTSPTAVTPFSEALDGNLPANRVADVGTGATFTVPTAIQAGQTFYLRWFDFNGTATDAVLGIDNFRFTTANPEPISIVSQPVGVTVTEPATVSLTVGVAGPNPLYQWSKDGVAIDTLLNPTAASATLVITNTRNARLLPLSGDGGVYRCSVANSVNSLLSDPATVVVNKDITAPRFLAAGLVPPAAGELRNRVRLIVSEPLYVDLDGLGECGFVSDPTDTFNWAVTAPGQDLGVEEIVLTGNRLDFRTTLEWQEGVQYTLTVKENPLSDIFCNTTTPFTSIAVGSPTTVSFQQGVNGYTGTQDTEVLTGGATPLGAATVVTVDNAPFSQGLLRFDGIFGDTTSMIPANSIILSASLIRTHALGAAPNGDPVNLHRMLVNWDQATATFNSLVNGVQLNGIEASAAIDAVIDSVGITATSILTNEVSTTVQAWASGAPNYGWLFNPTAGDGYRWDTSESPTPPILVVTFSPPPCDAPATIVISQQPAANTSVNEGNSFTLTVTTVGCGAHYQWFKGATPVGTDSPSYSVANAAAGPAGDAGTYTVRISNGVAPNVTSSAAVVTVTPNNVGPTITQAVAGLNGTTVTLTFSEPVSQASAEAVGNYTFNPPLAVSSAVLSGGNTVTLTTAARVFPTAYTLSIAGVRDIQFQANLISPNPTQIRLTSVQGTSVAWNDGTPWSYATNSQDATLAGTPWYAPAFTPGPEWLTGAGPFGFEDTAATIALLPAPIVTALQPNSVAAAPNDFVTVYFRRVINLPALPVGASYAMLAIIDDGAIFYLDGQPILTNNMPNVSPITFTNRASGAAAEGVVQTFPLNASSGSHTLAVELHQTGTTSSDVVFAFEIRILGAAPSLNISSASNTNTVSWTADSSWALEGAVNVPGAYGAQAGSNPLRFQVPSGATNHFYRLRYTGRP